MLKNRFKKDIPALMKYSLYCISWIQADMRKKKIKGFKGRMTMFTVSFPAVTKTCPDTLMTTSAQGRDFHRQEARWHSIFKLNVLRSAIL